MNPGQLAVVISICLFVGMAVCLEVGYRMGRNVAKRIETAHEGTPPFRRQFSRCWACCWEFTFANGISHLDQRRVLIIQESNAIGTAYLRLDLLPADQQQEMRNLFRQYLDARLGVYEKLSDLAAAAEDLQHAAQLQQEIWSYAIAGSRDDPPRTYLGCYCRR